jgi:uncharacterized protein (TIGR00251 family)
VTPNARKNDIRGLWRGANGEERLAIRITAPPDKGRANKAVLKLLAESLGLPKSALSIGAGEKDRLKTVMIAGDAKRVIPAIEALLVDKKSGEDA